MPAEQTLVVAQKLVDLCNAMQFDQAIDELYAQDIQSIEAFEYPGGMPHIVEGLDAVRAKAMHWIETHDIHTVEITGPYPHEERFAVLMKFEVTPKSGPSAGERIAMEEICLYTVADGKIIREEFFYTNDS